MTRITFFLLLLPSLLCAQIYKDTFEVVTIQQPQKFYLNSGGRSLVGGQSRIVIPVALPENTVEWFYTLTTINAQSKSLEMEKKTDNISSKLQLTQQLAKLVVKGINMAADFNWASLAMNLASTPSGGEMCAIYLLDKENSKKFLSKDDHAIIGKGFVYQREGTKENFNSGNVSIKSFTKGVWYLGISNPTVITGMYVSIEIAAVVQKKIRVEVSEEFKKASLYLNLAEQQFNNAAYDKSLDYFIKSTELIPTDPFPYFKIGLCKILIHDSTEAIDDYVTGISLLTKKPEAANSLLNLALSDLNKLPVKDTDKTRIDEIKKLIEGELIKYPNKTDNKVGN